MAVIALATQAQTHKLVIKKVSLKWLQQGPAKLKRQLETAASMEESNHYRGANSLLRKGILRLEMISFTSTAFVRCPYPK